jgi:5-methylcytosine-specific restriction enzyme subunit McrC
MATDNVNSSTLPTVLQFEEEREHHVPRTEEWERRLLALRAQGGFEISWAGPGADYHTVRPTGIVGLFPVARDTLVRVSPKVPVRNLFRMLEVAYRLASFRFGEGIVDAETVEGIYERLASLLADLVLDRARRGLTRGYVTHTDRLSTVRGRLDLLPTVIGISQGRARFECVFEEHTVDIEDNRLLLWALRVCVAGPLRPEIRTKVTRAYRALAHSIDLVELSPEHCIGRNYHRLNDDYRPMHALCRMLLEHSGPSHDLGQNRSVPFKLNMPRLFELFVAEYLRTRLSKEWRARVKVPLDLSQSLISPMEIDVVIERTDDHCAVLALDTKHKGSITTDDLQQVAFYAHQIGAMDALLVYPTDPPPPIDFVNGSVRVRSMGLNLARDPLDAAASFTLKLERLLDASHQLQ